MLVKAGEELLDELASFIGMRTDRRMHIKFGVEILAQGIGRFFGRRTIRGDGGRAGIDIGQGFDFLGGDVGGCDERCVECTGSANLHGAGDGCQRMDPTRLDSDGYGLLYPVGSCGIVCGFHAL